jgi:hypothetical protein
VRSYRAFHVALNSLFISQEDPLSLLQLLPQQLDLFYFAGIQYLQEVAIMGGPPNKRQKREEYKTAFRDNDTAKLPKKKFYRQRAHANPFSDHQLE